MNTPLNVPSARPPRPFQSGIILAIAVLVYLLPRAGGQTAYSSFYDGKSYAMNAWTGNHIVVLTPTARTGLDPQVMASIVAAIDQAYDYHVVITGRAPTPSRVVNGKLTIAAVEPTCGGGCGLIGATGVELSSGTFDRLYQGVRANRVFDQTVFYELARNFYFCYPVLNVAGGANFRDVVGNGFAVFMRYAGIRAANIPGSTDSPPGLTYSQVEAQIKGLIDHYEANSALDFSNTFAVLRGVPNTPYSAVDLFGSLLFRLERDYGELFTASLWKELARRPVARDPQGAIDSFFVAACSASHRNLSTLFADRWRWPLSPAARATAAQYDPAIAAPGTPRESKFSNVSTRGFVGTGDARMIVGFAITGTERKRTLIRAIGPTLSGVPFQVADALADPKLEIYSAANKVAENDDWSESAAATFSQVGAFSLVSGTRDAVVIVELQPGNYTAVVSGVNNTTGVVLVEAYELP